MSMVAFWLISANNPVTPCSYDQPVQKDVLAITTALMMASCSNLAEVPFSTTLK
jgi:hypothetical protein